MKKLENLYIKFFGKHLPTELILFNIIAVMGAVGALLTIPFNFLNHVSMALTISIFIAIAVAVGCFYAANYKNQLRNSVICLCFIVTIIMFPVMYFTSGGINSGMVCWFSLGILFIFLLLDGMDFFFMLLTDIAVILGCYIVSYYHPEYIVPLSTDLAIYTDVVQALFITALVIGVIIKFQTGVYNKLYTEAENNNDDLLEKTLAAKKAEKIAQNASASKSNFLANMSHEIRTPINTIMGMDEMILRETGEKKVQEYALDIKSASQTLLSLINDILDITKIESGKMTIVEGEYSFLSLMHDVLNTANIKARDKNLILTTDIAENIPCDLIGDDIRIKQILTNIITNAVKYTPQGSVHVAVSCRKAGANRVELYFSVKDTGIGIKEEDMGRLFKSFERLDVSRNRGIEGAGLGMAITQSLLNMMDSYLNVDSVYGKGSTFSFKLLQTVANEEPIGDFNKRLENMTAIYEYNSSFVAPDARFLVVDDNAMNRKVFVALLKESKVQVVEAADGRECLKLIQSQHFDMIFLDHMMPGMDGLETFKAMGSLEGNKCLGTPIIALTANAIAGAKERYLSLGFHGFLSKPIVSSQLEKTIREFLPAHLMQRAADSQLAQENDLAHKAKETDQEEKIQLPEIEGIDWDYALLHFPNKNILLESAVDFYKSIGNEIAQLKAYMDNWDTSQSMENYRIKVHAIKSMANTIGATALGGLAKVCEYAARDGKKDRIFALTPVLLEELTALKGRLKQLVSDEEKQPMEDPDDLYALLEMLKIAIKTYDSVRADNLMDQINTYSYDAKLQIELDKLSVCVQNLDDEGVLALIETLQQ